MRADIDLWPVTRRPAPVPRGRSGPDRGPPVPCLLTCSFTCVAATRHRPHQRWPLYATKWSLAPWRFDSSFSLFFSPLGERYWAPAQNGTPLERGSRHTPTSAGARNGVGPGALLFQLFGGRSRVSVPMSILLSRRSQAPTRPSAGRCLRQSGAWRPGVSIFWGRRWAPARSAPIQVAGRRQRLNTPPAAARFGGQQLHRE
ncbi:hypothetical protein NDU88_009340 [Pleurodeles waltl]|uniref:Uncharacterized protein n=1 Tax=Pleurodeles waltl TaxID=8319 RepID=A0AAV7QX32_PLEWA|nr:hypothetical protein NDU88_009340 [Pleurodeles waltl]